MVCPSFHSFHYFFSHHYVYLLSVHAIKIRRPPHRLMINIMILLCAGQAIWEESNMKKRVVPHQNPSFGQLKTIWLNLYICCKQESEQHSMHLFHPAHLSIRRIIMVWFRRLKSVGHLNVIQCHDYIPPPLLEVNFKLFCQFIFQRIIHFHFHGQSNIPNNKCRISPVSGISTMSNLLRKQLRLGMLMDAQMLLQLTNQTDLLTSL